MRLRFARRARAGGCAGVLGLELDGSQDRRKRRRWSRHQIGDRVRAGRRARAASRPGRELPRRLPRIRRRCPSAGGHREPPGHHANGVLCPVVGASKSPTPRAARHGRSAAARDIEPGAYLDENCVQADRVLDHANPSFGDTANAPEICGRLATSPLFVMMRRFVPGEGEGSGFPWGNNPARTLIYGAAAPRVTSLSLAGAGPARTLRDRPPRRAFHGGCSTVASTRGL